MAAPLATALKEVDLNASDAAVVAAAAAVETTNDPTACSFCNKPKATKRCSKGPKKHPKCLKKIFCDSVCETQVCITKSGIRGVFFIGFITCLQSHKKKVEAVEAKPKEGTPNQEKEETEDKKNLKTEADRLKAAKAKKARKAANAAKKGNDGSFWWNNAVYASW